MRLREVIRAVQCVFHAEDGWAGLRWRSATRRRHIPPNVARLAGFSTRRLETVWPLLGCYLGAGGRLPDFERDSWLRWRDHLRRERRAAARLRAAGKAAAR